MRHMLVVLAALLVVAAAMVTVVVSLWRAEPTASGKGPQLPTAESSGPLEMTTAGDSAARAARLLPTQGSEDRRDLLKQPAPPRGAAGATSHADLSFVIEARAKEGQSFDRSVIRGLLSADWHAAYGDPKVQVRGQEGQPWVYLMANNETPLTFAEINFEWPLVGMLAEETPPLSEAILERYRKDVV